MSGIQITTSQGSAERHAVQRALICMLARTRTKINLLEVGSFEGQSALNWSAAIADHCTAGGHVLCVDPWKPYHSKAMLAAGPLYQQMNQALGEGVAYGNFCHNATLADPRAPISHLVGTLDLVYDQLVGMWGGFDVVYLDGDHTASSVSADITLGNRLVVDGGLLCGDDLEMQGDKCNWEHTLAHAEKTDYIDNYHPGVTVAVWKALGKVWARDGLWAMQRVANGAWKEPEVT